MEKKKHRLESQKFHLDEENKNESYRKFMKKKKWIFPFFFFVPITKIAVRLDFANFNLSKTMQYLISYSSPKTQTMYQIIYKIWIYFKRKICKIYITLFQ